MDRYQIDLLDSLDIEMDDGRYEPPGQQDDEDFSLDYQSFDIRPATPDLTASGFTSSEISTDNIPYRPAPTPYEVEQPKPAAQKTEEAPMDYGDNEFAELDAYLNSDAVVIVYD